jgi:hypothetical protein
MADADHVSHASEVDMSLSKMLHTSKGLMRVLAAEINESVSLTAGKDGNDNSFNRGLLSDMLECLSVSDNGTGLSFKRR